MLRKLLKYDFKSVWRVWWIAAIITLGSSVIGSFALRFFLSLTTAPGVAAESPEITFAYIISLILFLFSLLAIVASVFVMEILVYWRYYKHFFSDEGYLTFTLPVSRKQLLLSKTLNAVIWTAIHAVLLTVCTLIFMIISPNPGPGDGFFNPVLFYWIKEAISFAVPPLFELFGAGWIIAYTLIGLIGSFGVTLFSISLVHFCITLGAVIAKKHKLLAAIGTYYLVNAVISFVAQAFITLFTLFIAGRFVVLLLEITSASVGCLVFFLIFFMIACVIWALASILYFWTLGALERKLNLA